MNNLYSIIEGEGDYKTQRIDMLRRIDKEYFISRAEKVLSRHNLIHIIIRMLNLIYIVDNRI